MELLCIVSFFAHENSTSRSEIITKLNASTEYKVYVVKKLEDANLFSNTITSKYYRLP